jgi:Ca2+-binding EF-hand superfamily protein
MNNSPQKTNEDDYFTEDDYKTIKDVIDNKPEQTGILRDVYKNEEDRKKAKREFKEAFSYFDKDNSGFIDSSELTYMLQSFGNNISSQDIRLLFGRELYKNNGFVNYDQLLDKLFGD